MIICLPSKEIAHDAIILVLRFVKILLLGYLAAPEVNQSEVMKVGSRTGNYFSVRFEMAVVEENGVLVL